MEIKKKLSDKVQGQVAEAGGKAKTGGPVVGYRNSRTSEENPDPGRTSGQKGASAYYDDNTNACYELHIFRWQCR